MLDLPPFYFFPIIFDAPMMRPILKMVTGKAVSALILATQTSAVENV